MVKIVDPLFGDDVRGTVGDLLTLRRGRHGPTAIQPRGPSEKPPGPAPPIRGCFAEAKAAHSALPIEEWYENGKLIRRRVPGWPEFWAQWLIDHPECLSQPPATDSIWLENCDTLQDPTYGAPVSGQYILGLWSWDYPDWRAADPNPGAVFHSIDVYVNGELAQAGITLDQPDWWAEHLIWLDAGDILTTVVNDAGELLDNIGYDIYGPDWTYYDSDGWNNDTSERETASGFDGTEILTPGIPVDWSRTSAVWQGRDSSSAGGSSPELVYLSTGAASAADRVWSPLIDASDRYDLVLRFRQTVRAGGGGGFSLKAQISFDAINWGTMMKQQPTSNQWTETIEINLSGFDDKQFHLAFTVEGNTGALQEWALDAIEVLAVA